MSCMQINFTLITIVFSRSYVWRLFFTNWNRLMREVILTLSGTLQSPTHYWLFHPKYNPSTLLMPQVNMHRLYKAPHRSLTVGVIQCCYSPPFVCEQHFLNIHSHVIFVPVNTLNELILLQRERTIEVLFIPKRFNMRYHDILNQGWAPLASNNSLLLFTVWLRISILK